jgi:hypothetical protein
LSPQQEEAIDAMTRGIVKKILHTPITELGRDPSLIGLIRRLFRLRSETEEDA